MLKQKCEISSNFVPDVKQIIWRWLVDMCSVDTHSPITGFQHPAVLPCETGPHLPALVSLQWRTVHSIVRYYALIVMIITCCIIIIIINFCIAFF